MLDEFESFSSKCSAKLYQYSQYNDNCLKFVTVRNKNVIIVRLYFAELG